MRGNIIQRTVATRTAERSGRTGDEHAYAFATDATDALCTGVAFVERPRALAIGTVYLDVFVAEGGRRWV